MNLGISSYTYTWAIGVPGQEPPRPMSPADLLQKAVDLGVSIVQIADNMPLHHLPETELAGLVAQAADLDIQIEVGTRGIALEHLQTYVQLAHRFCSPFVRVVIDTANHQPTVPETIALIQKGLPLFQRFGVALALENHDRFTTADFLHILETIGSNDLGICLDTVNSFGALEGPAVVVAALAPWTMNLHIKDFRVRRADHMMGFTIEGTPAGQGQLDIPWLRDTLQPFGRHPTAVLELWTPPETTVKATLEKETAWARESVAYLKTVLSQEDE